MSAIIHAKGIHKAYGKKIALNNVDLQIPAGRIVGLIGPNGAGKTTLLKGILGLATVEGDLRVLDLNPFTERVKLLEEVSFIADTAILPRWLRVSEALDYIEGVHPKFSREKAMGFLSKTNIALTNKVKDLSKGMVTQLHLALIMAIDSKLLVLDEPTLGLDIIYRKQFYEALLNDYYDAEKTVIITTHQVEEIEGILTDLLFINDGKILLETSMETLPEKFFELHVDANNKDAALALKPIHSRATLGGFVMVFENVDATLLEPLGKLTTPSVADLFVAKMQPVKTL
ncbi:ABC transporter ATP-binding protein [Cellvibrio zantedeschiae]|uniref:ABC transporter ATP-binding protein n=1 Tax=Cellvibrio zantedeschiae TaxID=1237077 RepID=A0ABQ3B7H4_9GAMM|nr:ABC transporter ATP-binding protein [Cellvibrio zantedeschiae]GGY77280.1 ABC transporter ATP-binding protein [Cellvibrio zantedeschiae]